nr:hypothetical protein [Tanacetum cinerariifolium]
MALTFADTHNMIAFLTKSDASEGFEQIIDFLNAHVIQYALMVNPIIYVSYVKQFWTSVSIKKANDVVRLQALIDRKKVIITEDTIRQALRLDDADGVDCLSNEEIFTELERMGYEKQSTKLTFYKAFFLAQWNLVRNVDSPSKFIMYPRFIQPMINAQDVVEAAVENKNDDNEVSAKPVPPSPTPATSPPPPDQKHIPSPPQAKSTQPSSPLQQQPLQTAEISMTLLNQLRLEKKRQSKTLGLKRLRKVGTTQIVESLVDNVMDGQEDASKQGEKIAELDANEDITLETIDAGDADVQERLDESQTKKWLLLTITAAQVPKASAPRKRRGVVIHDPEETATPSVIVHSEVQSKDKGKGILIEEPKPLKRQAQIEQDEAFTRKLEAELNANINWNDVIDQVKRKEKQDNTVMRYQDLKRKPVTKAQARKNIMVYLKNMIGFKMDFFREMTYNEIRPIFEKHYSLNQAFLERVEEEVTGQDEEEKELKTHLQILSNDEDDVYTEATPLALKVPVVDYQIHHEHNKPYYKIIREDGTYQLFLSFITLLKCFDIEDLEIPWKLVQERIQSSEPKNFSDDFLLNTFKKYPLTRLTLEQMLNNVRLEIEEESEMSLELLRLVRRQLEEGYIPEYRVWIHPPP